MEELYAASSICLYPSNSGEPFGLTMLEAMACAKPMIITNTGGMPEVIKDGINGFIVKPKSAVDLAEKMAYAIDNIQMVRQLGSGNIQYAHNNFEAQVITDQFRRIYNDLLTDIEQ